MDVLCKLCVSNRGASVNRYRYSNRCTGIYTSTGTKQYSMYYALPLSAGYKLIFPPTKVTA